MFGINFAITILLAPSGFVNIFMKETIKITFGRLQKAIDMTLLGVYNYTNFDNNFATSQFFG